MMLLLSLSLSTYLTNRASSRSRSVKVVIVVKVVVQHVMGYACVRTHRIIMAAFPFPSPRSRSGVRLGVVGSGQAQVQCVDLKAGDGLHYSVRSMHTHSKVQRLPAPPCLRCAFIVHESPCKCPRCTATVDILPAIWSTAGSDSMYVHWWFPTGLSYCLYCTVHTIQYCTVLFNTSRIFN
jgi:hypothetical protein